MRCGIPDILIGIGELIGVLLNEWVREARIVFFHDLDDVVAGCVFGKGSKDDKFTTANSIVVSKVAKDIWDVGCMVLVQGVDEEAAKEEIEVWRSMKRKDYKIRLIGTPEETDSKIPGRAWKWNFYRWYQGEVSRDDAAGREVPVLSLLPTSSQTELELRGR